MTNKQDNKAGGLKLTGTVASAKMANTVIVRVDQVKVHPKYHKRYRTNSKFAADTAGQQYAAGDRVEIQECRPLSKTKNWKVTRKLE